MKKVILIIRDGWGYRKSCQNNAICAANTPFDDYLIENYPNTLLGASGVAVGLPEGYQGNSEVGHMTIGSGRVIFQSLPRINKSIELGDFFDNKALLGAIENARENGTKLHIIGLLQEEGVHAHIDHLFAILDLCNQQNFEDILIHVITDGRDAPVYASLKHIKNLENKLKELGFGQIATIGGRFYAMDRDKRWERTKTAYDCIVRGICEFEFDNALKEVENCHKNDQTDEFIKPRKVVGYKGFSENDSAIFFNFRTDRPRQLTQAIVEKDFNGFEMGGEGNFYFVAMTQYYKPMNAEVVFGEKSYDGLLGEIVSKQGLNQLRISETEKYAHVTFFFNCQIEKPFEGEERELIPSPKVETYNDKPEMSAFEIAEKLTQKIDQKDYALVVTNLVNGDMVGHTGDIEATKKSLEAVDKATEKIVQKGLAKGYSILVFADHGNAEDQSPEWRTSHTTNPVPCILVSSDDKLRNCKLKNGKGLQDIAPTVLDILGIEKPLEMTGESLVSTIIQG